MSSSSYEYHEIFIGIIHVMTIEDGSLSLASASKSMGLINCFGVMLGHGT